jgi:hypothetical protein
MNVCIYKCIYVCHFNILAHQIIVLTLLIGLKHCFRPVYRFQVREVVETLPFYVWGRDSRKFFPAESCCCHDRCVMKPATGEHGRGSEINARNIHQQRVAIVSHFETCS